MVKNLSSVHVFFPLNRLFGCTTELAIDTIEAAKLSGASDLRVIIRHILPNSMSPIIVKASFDMGNAILIAAALGFIGLGAQPPQPEWGLLISLGRQYLPQWWWISTFPGVAIFFATLGFNFLGDGLRDILDPRVVYKDLIHLPSDRQTPH